MDMAQAGLRLYRLYLPPTPMLIIRENGIANYYIFHSSYRVAWVANLCVTILSVRGSLLLSMIHVISTQPHTLASLALRMGKGRPRGQTKRARRTQQHAHNT